MPNFLAMSDYPAIILKRHKGQSIQRRHPWIFSGAIHKLAPDLQEGNLVEVFDTDGSYLATGHYQIGSIAVRICSFKQLPIDADFWRLKLERAIRLRRQVGLWDNARTNMFRLIHGEGDGMPGLIIDWYHGVAVMQCHSIGFYHLRHTLVQLLRDLLGDELQAVYNKSQHTLPFKADVQPEDGYLYGDSQPWSGMEHGLQYQIDIETGQKTGFFLDQRDNRLLLQRYAEGKTILNAFSYTGGFSISALAGGAARVDSVDSSQGAIDLAIANAEANGFADRHRGLTADMFKYLQDIDDQYDLIILDPPAFAKHHKVLDRALRGYRTINHKAIQRIRPGGILFTFSCSQVVSRMDFRKTIFSAAALAGRRVRILHQLHQPADHPIDIYHPEGEYLKGLVLGVE